MASDTTTSQLLALPDPCLLAVMQRCADDAGDVLSAAAAHSRLQRAAVEALSSISARKLNQDKTDSLLQYLAKHGQHVRSLHILAQNQDVQLRELPPSLTKLDSLRLSSLCLQLQPGLSSTQGVLRAGLPLTRLELSRCSALDGAQGLVAALMQLPDLQHLSVCWLFDAHDHGRATIPTAVFSQLTTITCLKLQDVACHNSDTDDDPSAALQPLQALTRLADLELRTVQMCDAVIVSFDLRNENCAVTADTLSRADQLTRLVLSGQDFEPRTLAGKAQLKHLTLRGCRLVPGAGVAQLLSELQHLTQLMYLDLGGSCRFADEGDPNPPLTAYASLTASSKLQHLDFGNGNLLPSAAWQHMCPPGQVAVTSAVPEPQLCPGNRWHRGNS